MNYEEAVGDQNVTEHPGKKFESGRVARQHKTNKAMWKNSVKASPKVREYDLTNWKNYTSHLVQVQFHTKVKRISVRLF